MVLLDQNGKEVGIVYCKIGLAERTEFKWGTKNLLNYCGAGLNGKTKEVEPGLYKIAIATDETGRPIIDKSDDYFSIVKQVNL